jgi:exopolyphosphatase/guanosine-5'-triphosphate,3'-diphosphate pyrophosphatase
VDEMRAQPRLGAGLDATGALSADAMRRALEALGRMAQLAAQLGAKRVEAVATSAVRDASNGVEFAARVKRETGLRLRLLSGEEEARLSFQSALAHFDLGAGRAVVMDIGGGSLELTLSADGLIERLLSHPFGAIRLTDQLLADGTGRRGVRRMRRLVRAALRDDLPDRNWRGSQLIGSGGTFTSLAGIYLARHGMQRAQTVHATRVPRQELEHILDALQVMTAAERAAVPGLNPARADIIVAGLAVAAEVVARLHAREITVSAYGIREGLLLQTAAVAPPRAADAGAARERSVREFAERCHYEEPHARQVQALALQLFDQLGARLGCAPEDRPILADAALLHDVGYHIDYHKHHKHSYHLIVHAQLLGMSPEEQVVVANVARYHRGAEPKRSHEQFSALDRDRRDRIVRLAALLRVADGFDRGHVGAVRSVRAHFANGALRLSATPDPRASSYRLELWGASRKTDLLSKVLGAPVEVAAPDGTVVARDGDEATAD